jgi:aspartyl/asparaginyl beta-hydroxylase (cupin superfamily)
VKKDGWTFKIRDLIEKRIRAHDSSRVFPRESFPWAAAVESKHPQIQKEARDLLQKLQSIVNFNEVLPGQRALTQDESWKSYFLVALEKAVPEHQKFCPETTAALQKIPGVINAFFSVLTPGAYVPAHRGPYSGILRYHLGVLIPQGDVKIRIDQEIHSWAEGKSLFFDDSYEHEVWNRSHETRVVLFVDLVRPLPQPMNWLNRGVISLFQWSPQAQAGKKKVFETQLCFS